MGAWSVWKLWGIPMGSTGPSLGGGVAEAEKTREPRVAARTRRPERAAGMEATRLYTTPSTPAPLIPSHCSTLSSLNSDLVRKFGYGADRASVVEHGDWGTRGKAGRRAGVTRTGPSVVEPPVVGVRSLSVADLPRLVPSALVGGRPGGGGGGAAGAIFAAPSH
ncbi:hypothetical protein GUJ93_ZPchr0001g31754 [Zizania palustris]|uniref:Uncharacterized protein n=1 Tax=Zizania palustris TaxID=103762 RepID=A0A8J5SD02_ZIZPA|nr:hypothetical protein GUJ93_ZPchr0001g31754 [Zizania palustris]